MMKRAVFILKRKDTIFLKEYKHILNLYKQSNVRTFIVEDYSNNITLYNIEELLAEYTKDNIENCDLISDSEILMLTCFRIYQDYFANFIYLYSGNLNENIDNYPIEQHEFINNLISFKGIKDENLSKKLYVNINNSNYYHFSSKYLYALNHLASIKSYRPGDVVNKSVLTNKRYFNSETENFYIDFKCLKTINIHLYKNRDSLEQILSMRDSDHALIFSFFTLFYIDGKQFNDFINLLEVLKKQSKNEKVFEEYISNLIIMVKKSTYRVEIQIQLINILFKYADMHDYLYSEIIQYMDSETLDIQLWKSLIVYYNAMVFRKTLNISDFVYRETKSKNIQISSYLMEKTNISLEVKPRDNRIVILIDQLLSLYHSPTAVLKVQLEELLKHTDYQFLIIVEENMIHSKGEYIPGIYYQGNPSEKCISSFMELFSQERVGIYLADKNMNLASRTQILINQVEKFNPEVILSFSGYSTMQNILFYSYPVVNISFGSEYLPALAHTYLYKNEQRAKEIAQKYEKGEINIFKYMPPPIELPRKKEYSREDFGFGKDDFIIITSGNRIESEIDENLIDCMEKLLEENNKYKWLLVGSKPPSYLLRRYNQTIMKQIKHISFEEDLVALNKICDTSINPNRIGGGYSVRSCVISGIPVLMCNFESDGLSILGRDNVLGETYEDLIKEIKRMFRDPMYKELIAKKQLDFWKQISNNDDKINELRRFIDVAKEQFTKMSQDK